MTCPCCRMPARLMDYMRMDHRWVLAAYWAPCEHLANAVVVLIDQTELPRRTP